MTSRKLTGSTSPRPEARKSVKIAEPKSAAAELPRSPSAVAARSETLDLDVDAVFSDPRFDKEACANEFFVRYSLPGAKTALAQLRTEGEQVSQKTNQHIYQHYPELLHVHHELASMESDLEQMRINLLELQNLMTELNGLSMPEAPQKNRSSRTVSISSSDPPTQLSSSASSSSASSSNWEREMRQAIQQIMSSIEVLDSDLPLMRFETCVTAATRALDIFKKYPSLQLYESLRKPIQDRVDRLAKILLTQLQSPLVRKSSARKLINYLAQLGLSDRAREVFLESAVTALQTSLNQRKRQLTDPAHYVAECGELAALHFDSTAGEFQRAFPDSAQLSRFVAWLLAQLEYLYKEHFQNQVFRQADDFAQICSFAVSFQQTMQLSTPHCDLRAPMHSLLGPDLERSFRETFAKAELNLQQLMTQETWQSKCNMLIMSIFGATLRRCCS